MNNAVQPEDLSGQFPEVLKVLREAPCPPAPDLAPRVLRRIRRRRQAWFAASVCAPLAFVAGFFAILKVQRLSIAIGSASDGIEAIEWRHPPPRGVPAEPTHESRIEHLSRARDWLLRHQDPDGGWSMGRSGAHAKYTVGTSSLALLALLTDELRADTHDAVRRAIGFLLSQQREDGLFGPEITGSAYNHSLACFALLRARERLGASAEIDGAIRRGIDLIARQQRPEGGWAYFRATRGAPNSSVTVWALQILMEATASGLGDYGSAIDNGFAWLETTINEQGRAGYRRPGDFPNGPETLTAAVALCLLERDAANSRLAQMLEHVRRDVLDAAPPFDLYRAFFQASALRSEPRSDPELPALLARIESAQELEGDEAGSWPPLDRWSMAGGRVYSTALAVLTLAGAN